MKKVWWVVRIAVIVIASYCIFAPSGALTFRAVQAQEDAVKCDTTRPCGRNTENNGSSTCGSCSSGPNGNN
jgi:hypothetical protein